MDKTDVTNAQFAEFVRATGYVTVAERTPRAEDFPDAPRENLVPGGVVFTPPDHPVSLNDHFQWWSYVKGRELAPSERAKKQHQRQRELPDGPDRLRRCGGLCEMGGQKAANGS